MPIDYEVQQQYQDNTDWQASASKAYISKEEQTHHIFVHVNFLLFWATDFNSISKE